MVALTIICFFTLALMPNEGLANSSKNKPLIILAENKSQYNMIRKIVGNMHNIQYIFENEEDFINHYNEEGKIVNNIEADLFFYSGNCYEDEIKDMLVEVNRTKTPMVDISRGISSNCEYYWMNLDEYLIEIYNIKSAIQNKDPVNKQVYEKNYKKTVQDIKAKISTIRESKEKLSEYTFISIDDYFDTFYNIIDLEVIKCDVNNVDSYIEENLIERNKVIILKYSSTNYTNEEIKVINLENYRDNFLLSELVEYNYNQIVKKIKSN